jgi:hypothetical protein
VPPAYLLVLAEIISSTLKMEAMCFSETSVATQQTTRRHIPEDDTLKKMKHFFATTQQRESQRLFDTELLNRVDT